MAEQGKIVMPTVGATGGRGQLSSNQIYNESYRESNGGSKASDRTTGHPSGTGSSSNQRPAVCEPSLDLTNNPHFGSLSQTKWHNQPHARSNCSGSLPKLINKPTDGSLLQLRSHSKTAPAKKKTEYQSLFVPHPLTATVLPNQVVGPKSKTGFTEGTDLQFYTFQEKNRSTVGPRQIHSSVMKTDFAPPRLQQGTEAILGLCSRSFSESGYTRGVISPLAWPSSLLPSPQTKSSAPTEKIIGRKEPTGFLKNFPRNQVLPETPLDSSHFITHYQITFSHRGDLKKPSFADPAGIIRAEKSSSYHRRNVDSSIIQS